MADMSGLYGLLGGGAFLALIGTLLSTRTGRQKDFDARVDSALKQADEENAQLERENRFLATENARLYWLLKQHGVDPDLPITSSRGPT